MLLQGYYLGFHGSSHSLSHPYMQNYQTRDLWGCTFPLKELGQEHSKDILFVFFISHSSALLSYWGLKNKYLSHRH